jgi:hypothetical protein
MAVRNWSDGDLLTSAAMDELTTSMFARFANAAARDAFFVGDLAPVPGMKASMLDTGATLTYIVVNGVGYWAPQPGTLCFWATQAASQSMPLGATVLTNFTAPARNYGNWFDTVAGKFSPKVPGFYEFFGGVSFLTGSSSAPHQAGFRLNGTVSPPWLSMSEGDQTWTSQTVTVASFNARRIEYSMNGTTDYMQLAAAPGVATSTSATASLACSFGATYQGM